jgi:NADPH:quinone reductase-like Zn-dependent oxidoreductase
MKAVIWTAYGPPDVLQLQEVEKPSPKAGEVLVKVHAATVTAGDCEMRRLELPLGLGLPMRLYAGLARPSRVTILGQEMAGEIEAVGSDARRFKPGDQVFAATGFGVGAYAEYACLPEQSDDAALALKPANLTYEEAAAVPTGGLEALHFLRRAAIQGGETILINGAGGSIGTAAIQLARAFGAGEVTAVDSTPKLDMLRATGADHVVDYTQEDFTARGETYDVIFDVAGKGSFSSSVKALKPGGRLLLANPRLSHLVLGPWTSLTGRKQVISGTSSLKTADLEYLKELIEAGKLRPVIDRIYPLEQIVEAHRYVETGQKRGNVVVTLEPIDAG